MLNMALLLLSLALCIPVAMFCLEVLLALVPRRRFMLPPLPAGTRLAVLIPAHDEEAVIEMTLRTLIPTMPPGSRVLVVADNCTDATAAIARRNGAEVVERCDSDRRGKGFALDFGIRHLAIHPPQAVVFLDADCRVAPETVGLLAAVAHATGRPVQGLNLCEADPRGGAMQTISGLAFRFKNLVRALGLARLADTCHLTGTGMALPWPLAEQVRLADDNVVEDMQLGIDLALAGRAPLLVPSARVDSPLPQQRAAARTQRTRWEHGHLKTLLVESPRLAWLAIRHRRLSLLWLALDLAIPPLSLLVLALVVAAIAMFLGWLAGASSLPLVIVLTAAASLATAVLLGWAAHCRQQVPLSALLAAPLYAAAKLPIYLAFLFKRQQQWVRTDRDVGQASRLP
jgi:cellulose synthase/poly-beta-1,6-N-acetylglucosamine synthase-like glycosyltransferase